MDRWLYEERLALPLEIKIKMTLDRIREWNKKCNGRIYVSFSGGKDSTVLLHLARTIDPEIPAVFCDTGLEFPEIKTFVKSTPNVTTIRPKLTYRQVLTKYGYPIINKEQACAISRYRNTKDPVQRYRRLNGWPNGKKGMISKKWQWLIDAPFKISDACCRIMKESPLDRFAKVSDRKPMIGIMANESDRRLRAYLRDGCLIESIKRPKAWPLAFWTEENIWEYLKGKAIPYASIYDMGERRTGCIFCCFGVHKEKAPNRFQRLAKTHPKLYFYCIKELGLAKVLEHLGVDF